MYKKRGVSPFIIVIIFAGVLALIGWAIYRERGTTPFTPSDRSGTSDETSGTDQNAQGGNTAGSGSTQPPSSGGTKGTTPSKTPTSEVKPSGKYVTIKTPNASTRWKAGTLQNIQWSSNGLEGNYYIYLSKQSPAQGPGYVPTWARGVRIGQATITKGTYQWAIPVNHEASIYRLRISNDPYEDKAQGSTLSNKYFDDSEQFEVLPF